MRKKGVFFFSIKGEKGKVLPKKKDKVNSSKKIN